MKINVFTTILLFLRKCSIDTLSNYIVQIQAIMFSQKRKKKPTIMLVHIYIYIYIYITCH